MQSFLQSGRVSQRDFLQATIKRSSIAPVQSKFSLRSFGYGPLKNREFSVVGSSEHAPTERRWACCDDRRFTVPLSGVHWVRSPLVCSRPTERRLAMNVKVLKLRQVLQRSCFAPVLLVFNHLMPPAELNFWT